MLQAKLMEVEGQLADARADRRENHRERRMAEAVDSMRRLFPGEGLNGVGVCEGKEHTGVERQGAGACAQRLFPGARGGLKGRCAEGVAAHRGWKVVGRCL